MLKMNFSVGFRPCKKKSHFCGMLQMMSYHQRTAANQANNRQHSYRFVIKKELSLSIKVTSLYAFHRNIYARYAAGTRRREMMLEEIMFRAPPAEKRMKKLDFQVLLINDDHFKCPPQPHIIICRSPISSSLFISFRNFVSAGLSDHLTAAIIIAF